MADGNFTNNVPRDHNDRPRIYPKPGRGKTHADVVATFTKKKKNPPSYRRTTKFIGLLEDTYSLEKWALRMAIRGVAERADLLARVHAVADIDTREGKNELNAIVTAAQGHMRTQLKANLGSYLHHCTELKDLHGDNAALPSPSEWASLQKGFVDVNDSDYALAARDADVAAYLATKKRYGMRYSAIEQMRVFDPWEVAGTPDRIGTGTDERFGGKYMIEDVKTGDIDWDNNHREIAMQLAMYAHSTAYTHEGGRQEDLPPVYRLKAVVIHLPVMQARCELHFVDIQKGWEGCLRAQANWEWRSVTGLFTKLDEWEPANHLEVNAMRPSFVESAMQCNSTQELRDLWVKAHAGFGLTDQFKAAVRLRLDELGEGAA